MTKPEMIEAIRKACVKVNPEIVELKFGCKLKLIYENCSSNEIVLYAEFSKKNNIVPSSILLLSDQIMQPVTENKFTFDGIDIYKYKIIGREIGLADVLMTIRKIHWYKNWEIIKTFRTTMLDELCDLWNLTKPFSIQSEETIRFIYLLLQNNV